MKTRMTVLALSVWMGTLIPVPVAAAQQAARSGSSPFWTALLSWVPLLIFIAFSFGFAKYLRRARAMQQRSHEHMQKVENLLERIVEAVESKR